MAIAGIASSVLLLWLTPYGIGLYWDSMPYLESGQNYLAGNGLGRATCDGFKALTQYPPLYPIVLASGNAVGISVLLMARILSALLLGAVSILVGATIRVASGSRHASLVGAIWVGLSVPVLGAFSWAMSEPLYLLLWLASLVLMDSFVRSRIRRHLVGAAILSGLALMTRYVGIAPILAFALVLAVLAVQRRGRWRDLWLFASVSLAPLAAWTVRGAVATDAPFNRALQFHPPARALIRQGMDSVFGWFAPPSILHSEEAAAATLLLLFILVAIVAIATARGARNLIPFSSLVPLHTLSSVMYLILVLASMTFFDPGTELNDRILLPTFLSLTTLLLCAVAQGLRSRNRFLTILGLLLLTVSGVRQATQLPALFSGLRHDAQGYAASRWVNSEVGARLRELQPEMVYTNDITAVYFIAGLPSCAVPTDGSYDALATMRSRMKDPRAVLAIFGNLSGEFMPLDEIVAGLTISERLGDGVLYMTGDPASP